MTGRGDRLAGATIIGGAGLAIFGLLGLLFKILRLAVLGVVYAAAVLIVATGLAVHAIARRTHRPRPARLNVVGDAATFPIDRLDPADLDAAMTSPGPLIPAAQDAPTLADTDTMTRLDLTTATTTRPAPSTRSRLSALFRLLEARPSLEVDDATVIVDAAASFVAAGAPDAARRLVAMHAPATADELVEILAG